MMEGVEVSSCVAVATATDAATTAVHSESESQ